MTQPRHPSDEQLWAGGEAVDKHLAACSMCRRRHHVLDDEQQAVRGWLRASSGQSTHRERMPDDVTVRLEEVVRREARRRDDAVVRPLAAAPAGRRVSLGRPWLVAAAVAGVAAVGGTLLVPALDRGDLLAGGGDDAGTELFDAESDVAAEAGSPADASIPPIPPDVAEQAASRTDATLGSCGQALAADVGGAVVAATDVIGNARGGVLVTLDVEGRRAVWWLPTCEATSELAWGRDGLE